MINQLIEANKIAYNELSTFLFNHERGRIDLDSSALCYTIFKNKPLKLPKGKTFEMLKDINTYEKLKKGTIKLKSSDYSTYKLLVIPLGSNYIIGNWWHNKMDLIEFKSYQEVYDFVDPLI